MAVNKLSAQEFIQNSFSPVIATFCSPLVEQTCKKNNLTFTELLQPFCKLTAEANFRDPYGTLVAIRNLRIIVSDVNSRPPQPTMARKFLNESVSSSGSERTTVVQIGELSLDVPVGVPWFEAWRDTFLQVQFPSDHEFTKHYLACMLVVSSQELSPMDNYIQMASQLQQMQSISPAKLPKWFSPSVLRYYVLLHDNMDGNLSAAETTFELMKNTYGINNCFFLNINSQSESSINNDSHQPDPWSQFISKQLYSQDINEADINMVDGSNHTDGLGGVEPAQEAGETPTTPVILHPLSPVTEPHHLLAVNNIHDKSVVADSLTNCWPSHGPQHGAHLSSADLERLRQFINDFCIRCLIPHVETQIQQLTDINSNKKGVSRSLISATKRWFGSNKPGLPNSPTAAVMYLSDSPELQLRRLGDLCFMFGAYSLAFTAYHGAKRDFNADAAWLHYAGALEMAALSLFMQGSDTSRKAHEYAEESILTYLNSCRMPQFATRATLFSAECLKARNFHGEAAKQLIRMTSEDSDLRSALLLEQAAYCFLSSVRPIMPRKYAFHLVLAGHRYSKAGQRKHSLRCYRQAYQVYENKSWSLAEDHIHHTIGRQASNLKLTAEATEAFARLLPRASRQAATQQATFLREYLTAQQQLNQETGEMPILPLPIVECDSIQVLLGSCHHRFNPNTTLIPASGVTFDLNNTDQFRWWKVEEQLVSFASGSQSMVFKPTVELLTNFTNNTSCPVTYVGEPVLVSVNLNNPLHISIPLHHLQLLWSFIPNSEGLCQDNSSNMNSQIATTQIIDSVLLLPDSASKQIVLQVTPKEIGELRITGLAYNLAGDSNGVVAVAGRQLLMARGPKLRPAKDKKPEDGPIYAIDNRLRLNVMESAPCLKVSFEGLKHEMLCGELLQVTVHLENVGTLPVCRVLLGSPTPQLFSVGKHHPGDVAVLPLSQPLAPGQTTQLSMHIRAPDTNGNTTLEFLFYYDSQHLLKKPVYRLIRHSWPLAVYGSIQVTATATRSSSNSTSEEKLNLSIQVQNNNQVNDPLMSEICIARLSLYSIHWQLSSHAFFPPDLQLEAQELVHLMVQALRKDRSQPHLSCVVLDQDSQLSPFQDFLAPTLPETLEMYSEPTTLSDSESLELQAAITIQATLIIMWKGYVTEGSKGKRIAVGQHHVILKKIGEMSSWPPLHVSNAATPITPLTSLKIFGDESSKENLLSSSLSLKQRLLTFTLHYKLSMSHDFSLQRLCIVPVEVVVQNCSDCDLLAKLETFGTTTNTSSNIKGQLFSPHSCHWFHWVGFSRRVMSLGPHCSRSVHLSAAVAAPGAYDLGSHLVVQAKHSNDLEFVPQSWRSDAVLIVT